MARSGHLCCKLDRICRPVIAKRLAGGDNARVVVRHPQGKRGAGTVDGDCSDKSRSIKLPTVIDHQADLIAWLLAIVSDSEITGRSSRR